jgi:hypothetical protein
MARSIIEKLGTEAEIVAIDEAGTACAGAMYRSTDTTPEQLRFGASDGSLLGPFITTTGPQFYGDFPNDDTAGQNGVPLQGLYFLSPNNGYSLPGGSVKKRIEQ